VTTSKHHTEACKHSHTCH